MHYSIMFLNANICSLHERPRRNPAFSSRRMFSTTPIRCLRSTMQKTLPGTERSVMPFPLLQSMRLPFFGSLTTTPFLHSARTHSCCQHWFRKTAVFCANLLPSCFSNSAAIWSIPGALLFFNILIVAWVSSMVIALMFTPNSTAWWWVSKSYVVVGFGWFSVSWNCCIHRASCSSLLFRILPFLSLTDVLALLLAPVRSLTMRYNVLASFFSAASCVSSPLPSIHAFLSDR